MVKAENTHFKVMTFDHHSIATKPVATECPMVLAKDCDKSTDLFTLFGMRTTVPDANPMAYKLVMNLLDGSHTLEFRPSESRSGYSHSYMRIMWDKTEMPQLTEGTPVPIRTSTAQVGTITLQNSVIRAKISELMMELDVTPTDFTRIKVSLLSRDTSDHRKWLLERKTFFVNALIDPVIDRNASRNVLHPLYRFPTATPTCAVSVATRTTCPRMTWRDPRDNCSTHLRRWCTATSWAMISVTRRTSVSSGES